MTSYEKLPQTWADVVASPVSTVYLDEHDEDEGVRLLILRGPSSVNAYVGVPSSHPLAGHAYDDLPVQAHGGLTFSEAGKAESPWPKGWWWYGWDYSHSGDRATYRDTMPMLSRSSIDETAWTPEMVRQDAWSTVYDFKQLMRLAEHIKAAK